MAEEQPIVYTLSGRLRGTVECSCEGNNYYAFKGVPYAKPPVGPLRFADPEPPEPWSDIRDASDYGAPCAQHELLGIKYIGEEDCLFLNIFTKNLKTNRKQPVMMWIHGGGFAAGSGDDDLFKPDYFMRKDVVLVTINYRLAILGFLCLDVEEAPGNYGLKDQVMALKWIRHNIINFGGDPHNVTVFGESAGGASAHYLSISNLSRGLVHRAIPQSGSVFVPWSFAADPLTWVYRVCDILGISERDPEKILELLRAENVQKLVEAEYEIRKEVNTSGVVYCFIPVIDAKSKNPFMPIHPYKAAEEGTHIPIMIGYNSHEGHMSYRPALPSEVFESTFDSDRISYRSIPYLKDNYDLTISDLKKMYLKGDGKVRDDNRTELVHLLGHINVLEGMHRAVKTNVQNGSAPTYLYVFTFDKGPSALKDLLGITDPGACHFDELYHLFPHKIFEVYPYEPMDMDSECYVVSEKMIEMWVNFATHGRPTPVLSETVPIYWRPVTDGTALRYLNINTELRMELMVNIGDQFNCYKMSKEKFNSDALEEC